MATLSSIIPGEPYQSTLKHIPIEEIAKLEIYPEVVDLAAVTPGYVYVINELDTDKKSLTGFLKVGKSVDPYKRRSDLQTGNVRELEFLRITKVKDMTAAENSAHTALITYSVYYGGGQEWFYSSSGSLNTFIITFDNAVTPYT